MAEVEQKIRDNFATTRTRVREELAALNAQIESVAWSGDVAEVERTLTRRNAVELIVAAAEREGARREKLRSAEAAAQRARRVSMSNLAAANARAREEALSRVVAFDEELDVFARKRLPNANLPARIRARLERPAGDGDVAAAQLWARSASSREGVGIYVESLRTEREELRAKFDFTEEEIARHAQIVKRERARIEDLIVRGILPRSAFKFEGLVG
jgi:hypothetical protein